MAKSRDYQISFCPCEVRNGVMSVTISTLIGAQKHAVTAASFAELEAHVQRLAVAYGRTCHPMIDVAPRGSRKPAGFDAFCAKLRYIEVPAAA